MSDEWLDKDGYPTTAALDKIATWDASDPKGCLDFARSLWHWPDLVWIEHRPHDWKKDEQIDIICFSTRGWSGNESLIAALQDNFGVMLTWYLSKRGGRHEFEYRNFE